MDVVGLPYTYLILWNSTVNIFPDSTVKFHTSPLFKKKFLLYMLNASSFLSSHRHANVSLELLLKLVAVFGPVVRSAVAAPPSVGVDLHAEER